MWNGWNKTEGSITQLEDKSEYAFSRLWLDHVKRISEATDAAEDIEYILWRHLKTVPMKTKEENWMRTERNLRDPSINKIIQLVACNESNKESVNKHIFKNKLAKGRRN